MAMNALKIKTLRISSIAVLTVSCITFSSNLWAKDVATALQSCSEEENSLKRLVCFDQIVKNMRQYDGLEQRVASIRNSAPAPTSGKEGVSTASSRNNESNSVDSFGAPSTAANDVKMVDGKLMAVLQSVTKLAFDRHRFELANGQIWEQTESKGPVPKQGDNIIVEKGVLGAFFLRKADSNRRFRVKRIK